MEKFFEQLTSYNILNNLLPGTIFCYLPVKFLEDEGKNTYENYIGTFQVNK